MAEHVVEFCDAPRRIDESGRKYAANALSQKPVARIHQGQRHDEIRNGQPDKAKKRKGVVAEGMASDRGIDPNREGYRPNQ